MDKNILAEYGIDYEVGISRCMGDEALYAKLLGMFLNDNSYDRMIAAYKTGNLKLTFQSAHELKGACGNAAMTDLFKAVSPLVEQLRKGTEDPVETARLIEETGKIYENTKEGVILALGI